MLDPGTRLGPYTIVELVAVGGMGEVYRAEDTRLQRDVAIKVLPADLARDRASLDRFAREARAVASLSHPNILSIFDYGEEEGVQYAVTEMLQGETLRSRLSRGRVAPPEALALFRDILAGVAAAHARGIVHRDLKPENIFITSEGRVKVLDFGLARRDSAMLATHGAHALTEVLPTEPGVVIGTMGYLAPEQVEARPTTTATDLFALGCILFEMTEGRLPFEGLSRAQAMVSLLRDPAPHASDPGIDRIVQACLQKDPNARPRDAGAIAGMLRNTGRVSARQTIGRAEVRPAFIALLVAIAVVASFFFLRSRSRLIDHGYDLRASDVRGDGETRRLLELALRADAEGNRPKAMGLLEEAWRRPSKTAFPPAFLSSFNDAAGNDGAAKKWATEALKRLDGASPYESLLVRYLSEPSGYASGELALAKSALELRPEAWRLRLAAAHILLGQRNREAARRELQAIDVRKPDDRRLMLVLADRASLGDVDGAERALRASRLVERPAIYNYTAGRIAWSRGDARHAQQLFDRAAQEGENESLPPLEVESRLLSGAALIRLHAWDEAQRQLTINAGRARKVGLGYRAFESTALAAYAAHRAGDAEERDRRFAEAAALGPPLVPMAALRLLAIRLRSDMWKSWSVEEMTREPHLAATLSLMRAREAMFAGDRERARRELRRARAEGIDAAEQREEAELLAAELGLPFTLLPPDPPYPNLLRYLAVFDLQERIATGTGVSR